jgi:hypothetical protein
MQTIKKASCIKISRELLIHGRILLLQNGITYEVGVINVDLKSVDFFEQFSISISISYFQLFERKNNKKWYFVKLSCDIYQKNFSQNFM